MLDNPQRDINSQWNLVRISYISRSPTRNKVNSKYKISEQTEQDINHILV
jgi:hypothetical protein